MQENSNVKNVTNKKRGVTEKDLIEAIEICECDINEVAELLNISVRHTYRLINTFNLKEYYYKLKDDNATENSIADFTKDVIVKALIRMNKKLLEDKDLSKQEVVLLIFTAKSKAGFIEAKKENDSGDNEEDEQINIIELPNDQRNQSK